jgi:flagellar protein FlaG
MDINRVNENTAKLQKSESVRNIKNNKESNEKKSEKVKEVPRKPFRKNNESVNKDYEEKNQNHLSSGAEDLIDAIQKSNKELNLKDVSFEFDVHEKTKRVQVKIIDNKTEEVIKEIPPEEILDMVAKMWEIAGIFVDEQR